MMSRTPAAAGTWTPADSSPSSERERFVAEMQLLRRSLQERSVDHGRVEYFGRESAHPVVVVVSPPQQQQNSGRAASKHFIPPALALFLKLAGLGILAVAVWYGPSYYTCNRMKETGLFYYGTTVSSCVSERVAQQYGALQSSLDRAFRNL